MSFSLSAGGFQATPSKSCSCSGGAALSTASRRCAGWWARTRRTRGRSSVARPSATSELVGRELVDVHVHRADRARDVHLVASTVPRGWPPTAASRARRTSGLRCSRSCTCRSSRRCSRPRHPGADRVLVEALAVELRHASRWSWQPWLCTYMLVSIEAREGPQSGTATLPRVNRTPSLTSRCQVRGIAGRVCRGWSSVMIHSTLGRVSAAATAPAAAARAGPGQAQPRWLRGRHRRRGGTCGGRRCGRGDERSGMAGLGLLRSRGVSGRCVRRPAGRLGAVHGLVPRVRGGAVPASSSRALTGPSRHSADVPRARQ